MVEAVIWDECCDELPVYNLLSRAMSLSSGARLGSYEIIAPLGSGGMGEVYRARDLKLNREVALKVLPESFAADPDRLARFKREAQVLAALNHPHIGHIYGFEDGAPSALVLELIEGPTLADVLKSGPIGAAEAVVIARQIAGALEAAHEQGIIHRDLKPANIKVRADGTVKVLDFGLAKAIASAAHDRDHAATVTAMTTEAGMILGTTAYMAPEQAQGKPVDRRADIWAFGAVLYEMLAGRRAFDGESRSDTLAAVLRQDVDWQALPPETPSSVRRLLARCLDRDATRRLRDIGEARIALEPSAVSADPAAPASVRQRAIPALLGAIAALVVAGAMWYLNLEPPPSRAVTRFTIDLPDGHVFTGLSGRALALSPDGSRLVFVSSGQLHLQALAESESKRLQGSEGLQAVADPVFSPDGREIAFHAVYDQSIKRLAVTGGAAVTITKADLPYGLHWGPEGIVYGQRQGIMRVSPDGGSPETLVTVNAGETAYGPQLLPGGRHVLFTLATGDAPDRWNRSDIIVQSVASGERKTIINGGSDARYVSTGHLVYALGGTVLAVAFDPRSLATSGSSVPMIEGVRRVATGGAANFFVSESGHLVYVRGPAGTRFGQDDLALIDRAGRVQPLNLEPGRYVAPRVSPDGTAVAFGSEDGKEAAVFTYALSGTSAMRRLTFGGNSRYPTWTPDSTRVAFQSDRGGDPAIFWQRVDGGGAAEQLTTPDRGTSHEPETWSPDGAVLLYSVTRGSDVTLWMLSLRDRKVAPFGNIHSVTRTNAVFSPDGRWVAYASTENGVTQTFVEPFPPTGARFALPAGLASQPLWMPNGEELLFNPRPGNLATVRVTRTPAFSFSRPVEFERTFQTGPPAVRRAFDVTRDGRFVGIVPSGQSDLTTREMNSEIRMVLNWVEELKTKVPRQ